MIDIHLYTMEGEQSFHSYKSTLALRVGEQIAILYTAPGLWMPGKWWQ